jgi:4-amino-4-deoxy-L-arabinose transferase-like glycosyltransferase
VTLPRQHHAFVVLIAFAAIVFLSDIWIYKEFVRAESYFALGSRSMVEQGDWLTPHAPDELPLNKPPLTYWLIGISYRLFGANYGSARLPSVLAALGVLFIVYWLAVRLEGIRAGVISVAVLASSYLFLSFARMAMSDMLLTLCVTASLACFIVVLRAHGSGDLEIGALPDSRATAPSARRRSSVSLGYAALALGVLVKGPVALALVAMPVGLELVLRRSREDLKRLRLIRGLILLVLIAAPYFFFVYARLGAGPLRFFFFGENLQRFTGQIYGAAGRPFWHQLVAFFSDFAPWSLLILVAIWFDLRGRKILESKTRATRLLYLWLGWMVLLFSLSSFKLDYYLLPSMPAAALIIGPVIAHAENLPRFMRAILAAFLVVCSAAIVLVALLSVKAADVLSVPGPVRFLPVVAAVLGLLAIAVYLARRRTFQAALILAVTIWATILTIQLALLPAFVRYLPATQLAASVPAGSILFTSRAASDWANCIAYNLPPPHKVERLAGDANNEVLRAALRSDAKSVAVIWEREYASLALQDSSLKILARVETFGHGGLSLKIIRDPRAERLLVVGH